MNRLWVANAEALKKPPMGALQLVNRDLLQDSNMEQTVTAIPCERGDPGNPVHSV